MSGGERRSLESGAWEVFMNFPARIRDMELGIACEHRPAGENFF